MNHISAMKISQTTQNLPGVCRDLGIPQVILLIKICQRTFCYKLKEDIEFAIILKDHNVYKHKGKHETNPHSIARHPAIHINQCFQQCNATRTLCAIALRSALQIAFFPNSVRFLITWHAIYAIVCTICAMARKGDILLFNF